MSKRRNSLQEAPTDEEKIELIEKKKVDPRNSLNDLNSTEWIPETVSVWNQKGLGDAIGKGMFIATRKHQLFLRLLACVV